MHPKNKLLTLYQNPINSFTIKRALYTTFYRVNDAKLLHLLIPYYKYVSEVEEIAVKPELLFHY